MAGKPRLTLLETNRGYEIGWFDPSDGEFGLMLSGREVKDPESNAAIQAIKLLDTDAPQVCRITGSWLWESKPKAQIALRVAKAAIAALQSNMPDWAAKAVAEGWKPPKGWKP